MSKCEKDVSCGSRGSRVNKSSPQRLVAISLAFIVVKLLIFLRGDSLMAVMSARAMLRPAKEPQSEPGACAPQHTGCCSSSPLQALLGEAPALGGRRFLTLSFSSTPEAASTLTVHVLCTWAQCCHKQQPNPQWEKLLLATHYWRSAPCKKHINMC